jgi:hypothetical protein
MDLRDVITALGGPAEVAIGLGVKPGAVANWSWRGRLPSRHAVPLWIMANDAGLTWRPAGTEGLSLAPRPTAKVAETLTPTQDETALPVILPAIDTAA